MPPRWRNGAAPLREPAQQHQQRHAAAGVARLLEEQSQQAEEARRQRRQQKEEEQRRESEAQREREQRREQVEARWMGNELEEARREEARQRSQAARQQLKQLISEEREVQATEAAAALRRAAAARQAVAAATGGRDMASMYAAYAAVDPGRAAREASSSSSIADEAWSDGEAEEEWSEAEGVPGSPQPEPAWSGDPGHLKTILPLAQWIDGNELSLLENDREGGYFKWLLGEVRRRQRLSSGRLDELTFCPAAMDHFWKQRGRGPQHIRLHQHEEELCAWARRDSRREEERERRREERGQRQQERWRVRRRLTVALVGRRARAAAAQPDEAQRRALPAELWELVPTPCRGLGRALPAVLACSCAEARLLVQHLPKKEAARGRLRAAALCLRRLPVPKELHSNILSRVLADL
eukprot:scaffold4.g4700.t1